MFEQLNFPLTKLKIKDNQIWDILRQRYVNHTPEEWVRQHMIHFLINEKGYSKNLMKAEHVVEYNKLKKRCDIVIFNNQLKPILIVECKAPDKKLSENTFYQIAKYYSAIKAPLLVLTNGINHVHALVRNGEITYLEKLPNYNNLTKLTA